LRRLTNRLMEDKIQGSPIRTIPVKAGENAAPPEISAQMERIWTAVLLDTVEFHSEKLGDDNLKVEAESFHMPFPAMHITFSEPYDLNGEALKSIRIIDRKIYGGFSEHDKLPNGVTIGRYNIVSPDTDNVISFNVLETGEIEVSTMYADKDLPTYAAMSREESAEVVKQADLHREAHMYNLVYDTITMFEYINRSKYVLTKHRRDKNTGQKRPKDFPQLRIRIKHTKPLRDTDYKGTGKGTKHRYKYRVRGHWRELNSGKRTWVHDHVRGGDGSVFIPKEYDVL